jgi:hypothetical protein
MHTGSASHRLGPRACHHAAWFNMSGASFQPPKCTNSPSIGNGTGEPHMDLSRPRGVLATTCVRARASSPTAPPVPPCRVQKTRRTRKREAAEETAQGIGWVVLQCLSSTCNECGCGSISEHQRTCKDCVGWAICELQRRRSWCKD